MKCSVGMMSRKCLTPILGLFAAYSGLAADPGLIGVWKLDDGSGEVARDSSGQGGDCEIRGAKWVDGKTGEQLEFNGDDNFLQARRPETGNISGAFSISFWMKPAAWDSQYSAGVLGKRLADSDRGYVIYADGTMPTKINLRAVGTLGGYGMLPSASDVDEDVWQHWTVTYDQGAKIVRWYKNGKPDKTHENIAIGDMSNDKLLQIGFAATWRGHLAGRLKDIRIFNRPLSAVEVQDAYEAGRAIVEPVAALPSFPLRWRVVAAKYPAEDMVIAGCTVQEAGAKGDGSTDDTAAFRAAMDAMRRAGGGTVFVPEGRYAIGGNLRVPTGVTLRGEWEKPDGRRPLRGTVLMAYAGRGNADGQPFIALSKCSGIRNLAIWYPEQDAGNIVPYPFCLKQLGLDNATIRNVTLINPYQGIRTAFGSELHYFHEIYGSPLAIGLEVDFVSDSGRVDKIDFNPDFWNASGLPGTPARNGAHAVWMKEHGMALLYRRYEWIYSADVTVRGYNIGLKIMNSPTYGENNGQMYRCSITGCRTAVEVIDANFAGLSFTECRLEGEEYGLVTSPNFNSRLLLHTCQVRGGRKAALLQGIPNQAVMFRNCRFVGEVERTSGDLLVAGCTLESPGDHIRLGDNVNSVTMIGNTFKGAERIEKPADSRKVQVLAQPLPPSLLPKFPVLVDGPTKPPKSDLFVVTDAPWKAKKDAVSDDTAAIQAALDAAARKGGGIVFLPGGEYAVRGNLTVPSGVELRGVYDVPHHPMGKGSVVRIYAGRNDERAAPFIVLKERAGLRGLTFIYPEQRIASVVPYPFTVQGRGKDIYVINVTAMNPYQMLDFKSYRCDNHYLDYPSGAPLKVGIAIGGGSVGGQLLNTQFNAHYWGRSPFPDCPGDSIKTWDYQHGNLDAFVLGDCKNELLYQNCVFASRIGLHGVLENGAGASGAWVLGHGTDGSRVCMTFDGLGSNGIDIVNSQLVAMSSPGSGNADKCYLECGPALNAPVRLYNTTLWGTPTQAANVHGGSLVLDLAAFHSSGPFNVNGGKIEMIFAYLLNGGGGEIAFRSLGATKAGPQ